MNLGAGWTVRDVEDTRDVDLVGDRWVPIPGSGDPIPCDCCGRIVVIHVVITRGEERKIVGRSCALKMARIAGDVRAMNVRVANPIVDALLSLGMERWKAVRIGATLRAIDRGECTSTAWDAVYGGLTREQLANINRNPSALAWHERVAAALAPFGISLA